MPLKATTPHSWIWKLFEYNQKKIMIIIIVISLWSSRPVGSDILRDLERKASMATSELDTRRLYLSHFARSGFTPQLEQEAAQRDDLLLFDLSHIVAGN